MTSDQPPARVLADSSNALLLVDGDNIGGKFHADRIKYWFDDVVEALPMVMPNVVIGRVCIFINARGRGHAGLRLRQVERFCLHQYDRHEGEPGPPDTEILQEAWRLREYYDPVIFMSYDTDFAWFARQISQGIWSPGDDPDPAYATRAVLLTERPPGGAWRTKHDLPIDTSWDDYARPWVSIRSVLEYLRNQPRSGRRRPR